MVLTRRAGDEANGDQPAGSYVLKFAQHGALDAALPGEHRQVTLFLEVGDRNRRRNSLVSIEVDEANQQVTLGCAARAGNLVGPLLIDFPLVAEEEDGIQRMRREEVDHFILFARIHPDDPPPASALRAVDVHRHPLNVAALRDGDEDLLLSDEILFVKFGIATCDACAALVAVRLLQGGQVILDQLQDLLWRGEDFL